MNLKESFNTAISSLRANTMRSLLTMLGIIIGIASVIGLMGVGEGFSNFIEGEINAVGTNLIFVQSDSESGYPTLTQSDLDALQRENSAAITSVAGAVSQNAELIANSSAQFSTVSGVTGSFFTINNLTDTTNGTLFDEIDNTTHAAVAVLGYGIANDIFGNENPVGQSVTINDASFEVVAVLAANDGGVQGSSDDNVYLPLNTALQRLDVQTTRLGEPALSLIYVQASDESLVEAAQDDIASVLRNTHDLVYGAADDFAMQSQSGLVESFGSITGTLTVFLGAIAGISLVVGGIGIMNIMLVSVTERTREIGVRKAMGALRRDVLVQFLLESLILTMIGGAIGVVLGIAVSIVGAAYVNVTASVSASTVLLAVGFSALVGIVFGIYPAWQAANLRPIDALRYE